MSVYYLHGSITGSQLCSLKLLQHSSLLSVASPEDSSKDLTGKHWEHVAVSIQGYMVRCYFNGDLGMCCFTKRVLTNLQYVTEVYVK